MRKVLSSVTARTPVTKEVPSTITKSETMRGRGEEGRSGPMVDALDASAMGRGQRGGMMSAALARLEETALLVHATEIERRERELIAVSTKGGFSAVIKHGGTVIELQDGSFAIHQTDCD